MPRKTTGCWTCRVRKKKCDDGRPCCSSCTLRGITCYGYAAKPQWMEGGETERRIMQDIRHQVKESYRRRRSRGSGAARLQTSTSQRDGHESNASTFIPSPSHVPTTFAPSLSPASAWPQEDPGTSDDSTGRPYPQHNRPWENEDRMDGFDAYCVVDDARSGTQNPHAYARRPDCKCSDDPGTAEGEQSCARDPTRSCRVSFDFDERGIDSVMYYLDHIWPRLVPYLELSAGGSGRGWLLNLFLRTKPLYTAAVCLSACDKAQFVLGPLSDIPQPNHDLEMQHLQSVADLRGHLYRLSKKAGASQMAAGVEALACIMHLILFEVRIPTTTNRPLGDSWVTHADSRVFFCRSSGSHAKGS